MPSSRRQTLGCLGEPRQCKRSLLSHLCVFLLLAISRLLCLLPHFPAVPPSSPASQMSGGRATSCALQLFRQLSGGRGRCVGCAAGTARLGSTSTAPPACAAALRTEPRPALLAEGHQLDVSPRDQQGPQAVPSHCFPVLRLLFLPIFWKPPRKAKGKRVGGVACRTELEKHLVSSARRWGGRAVEEHSMTSSFPGPGGGKSSYLFLKDVLKKRKEKDEGSHWHC